MFLILIEKILFNNIKSNEILIKSIYKYKFWDFNMVILINCCKIVVLNWFWFKCWILLSKIYNGILLLYLLNYYVIFLFFVCNNFWFLYML